MKKIILLVMVVTSLLTPQFLLLTHSDAANVFNKPCSYSRGPRTSVCKEVAGASRQNPIINIIKATINIISILAGIAAVIGIIVSGLRMILSGGDTEAAASARNGLLYSLIGIAVIALAQAIVVFVLNRL